MGTAVKGVFIIYASSAMKRRMIARSVIYLLKNKKYIRYTSGSYVKICVYRFDFYT